MVIHGAHASVASHQGSVRRVIRPAAAALPSANSANGGNYSYAQAVSAADQAIEQDSSPPELQQTATSLLPFAGLAIAIVTSIFYVFPAGTPQPGDALLAITIVLTILLANYRLPASPKLYSTLGLFLAWVVLVNSVWFVLIGDYTFLRKTSFYFYNGAIMLFILSLGIHDYDRLRKVVYWSCITALLMELFYLEFIYTAAKMRSLGTFNNPNQMGYWGLLTLACLGVARRREPLRVMDAAALAIGCYVIAQTLSRAATAAGLLMALAVAISGRWTARRRPCHRRAGRPRRRRRASARRHPRSGPGGELCSGTAAPAHLAEPQPGRPLVLVEARL